MPKETGKPCVAFAVTNRSRSGGQEKHVCIRRNGPFMTKQSEALDPRWLALAAECDRIAALGFSRARHADLSRATMDMYRAARKPRTTPCARCRSPVAALPQDPFWVLCPSCQSTVVRGAHLSPIQPSAAPCPERNCSVIAWLCFAAGLLGAFLLYLLSVRIG